MDRNFCRLFDTLSILPTASKVSTTEIQRRLEARGHCVTARTVQRDLEQLATRYPIECDDRGKPFGWSWRKDAVRMSLPGMDWPEAISLHLLSTYLEGVLPSSVRAGIRPFIAEAERKLSQHVENLPLKRWPERVRVVHQGVPMLAPRTSAAVQATMTEAVLLGRKVRMHYQPLDGGSAKSYTVEPLGLVQYGPVFYLPVRYAGHTDIRTITLHRIKRAEVLAVASDIASFDLAKWIESGALGFGGVTMVALVMRADADIAAILGESPLSTDQQIAVDSFGCFTVSATVRDTEQLLRWILGQGRKVRVMQPNTLVERVRLEVMSLMQAYSSG